MSLGVRLLGSKAHFSILINVTAQQEYVYTKGAVRTKNSHDTELHDHLPCFESNPLYRWDTHTKLLYVSVGRSRAFLRHEIYVSTAESLKELGLQVIPLTQCCSQPKHDGCLTAQNKGRSWTGGFLIYSPLNLLTFPQTCIMLMASGRPGACATGRTASGFAILAALVCLRSLAMLLRAFGGPVGS